MSKDVFISAIDIGSDSIKGMIVSPQAERGSLEVLGYYSLPSLGLRKGMVVDPDKVCEKVNQLKSLLEKTTKRRIKDVFVNIGGYHVNVQSGYGAIAISRADKKVSLEDKDRVVEEARSSIVLPSENREILEIRPREFVIDNEAGIKNPIDLQGIKLEVDTLAICAFSPYVKNLINAVLCADLAIADIIPSPLASAEAVLAPQQKELGVVLIDIGAGSTGIAVFEEETLIHLAILPVGSSHISNDIAIALQTDIDIAENIKLKFGRYIFKKSTKTEKIELSPDEVFSFSANKMAKAGRARVSEIFSLIKKELKKISKCNKLPAGVVLTGGGSKLPGIVDFAKQELNLPARIGTPEGFIGIEKNPSLATLCGLILKGVEFTREEGSSGRSGWILPRAKKMFRIFLP